MISAEEARRIQASFTTEHALGQVETAILGASNQGFNTVSVAVAQQHQVAVCKCFVGLGYEVYASSAALTLYW
jgi:hypothetical protein